MSTVGSGSTVSWSPSGSDFTRVGGVPAGDMSNSDAHAASERNDTSILHQHEAQLQAAQMQLKELTNGGDSNYSTDSATAVAAALAERKLEAINKERTNGIGAYGNRGAVASYPVPSGVSSLSYPPLHSADPLSNSTGLRSTIANDTRLESDRTYRLPPPSNRRASGSPYLSALSSPLLSSFSAGAPPSPIQTPLQRLAAISTPTSATASPMIRHTANVPQTDILRLAALDDSIQDIIAESDVRTRQHQHVGRIGSPTRRSLLRPSSSSSSSHSPSRPSSSSGSLHLAHLSDLESALLRSSDSQQREIDLVRHQLREHVARDAIQRGGNHQQQHEESHQELLRLEYAIQDRRRTLNDLSKSHNQISLEVEKVHRLETEQHALEMSKTEEAHQSRTKEQQIEWKQLAASVQAARNELLLVGTSLIDLRGEYERSRNTLKKELDEQRKTAADDISSSRSSWTKELESSRSQLDHEARELRMTLEKEVLETQKGLKLEEEQIRTTYEKDLQMKRKEFDDEMASQRQALSVEASQLREQLQTETLKTRSNLNDEALQVREELNMERQSLNEEMIRIRKELADEVSSQRKTLNDEVTNTRRMLHEELSSSRQRMVEEERQHTEKESQRKAVLSEMHDMERTLSSSLKEERDTLKNDLSKLQEEWTQLSKQLSEGEDNLRKMFEAKGVLEDTNNDLKQQQDLLELELQHLSEKKTLLLDDCLETSKQFESWKMKIQDARIELEKIRAQQAHVRRDVNEEEERYRQSCQEHNTQIEQKYQQRREDKKIESELLRERSNELAHLEQEIMQRRKELNQIEKELKSTHASSTPSKRTKSTHPTASTSSSSSRVVGTHQRSTSSFGSGEGWTDATIIAQQHQQQQSHHRRVASSHATIEPSSSTPLAPTPAKRASATRHVNIASPPTSSKDHHPIGTPQSNVDVTSSRDDSQQQQHHRTVASLNRSIGALQLQKRQLQSEVELLKKARLYEAESYPSSLLTSPTSSSITSPPTSSSSSRPVSSYSTAAAASRTTATTIPNEPLIRPPFGDLSQSPIAHQQMSQRRKRHEEELRRRVLKERDEEEEREKEKARQQQQEKDEEEARAKAKHDAIDNDTPNPSSSVSPPTDNDRALLTHALSQLHAELDTAWHAGQKDQAELEGRRIELETTLSKLTSDVRMKEEELAHLTMKVMDLQTTWSDLSSRVAASSRTVNENRRNKYKHTQRNKTNENNNKHATSTNDAGEDPNQAVDDHKSNVDVVDADAADVDALDVDDMDSLTPLDVAQLRQSLKEMSRLNTECLKRMREGGLVGWNGLDGPTMVDAQVGDTEDWASSARIETFMTTSNDTGAATSQIEASPSSSSVPSQVLLLPHSSFLTLQDLYLTKEFSFQSMLSDLRHEVLKLREERTFLIGGLEHGLEEIRRRMERMEQYQQQQQQQQQQQPHPSTHVSSTSTTRVYGDLLELSSSLHVLTNRLSSQLHDFHQQLSHLSRHRLQQRSFQGLIYGIFERDLHLELLSHTIRLKMGTHAIQATIDMIPPISSIEGEVGQQFDNTNRNESSMSVSRPTVRSPLKQICAPAPSPSPTATHDQPQRAHTYADRNNTDTDTNLTPTAHNANSTRLDIGRSASPAAAPSYTRRPAPFSSSLPMPFRSPPSKSTFVMPPHPSLDASHSTPLVVPSVIGTDHLIAAPLDLRDLSSPIHTSARLHVHSLSLTPARTIQPAPLGRIGSTPSITPTTNPNTRTRLPHQTTSGAAAHPYTATATADIAAAAAGRVEAIAAAIQSPFITRVEQTPARERQPQQQKQNA